MEVLPTSTALLLSSVLALEAAPVRAGELYFLGAVGLSRIDVERDTIDNALRRAGTSKLSSSTDNDDSAYKVQVGYLFNPNFAIEGGYVNLGKATYAATFTQGSATASIKVHGPNVAALGIFPITDSFSLFGKLGAIQATTETEVQTTRRATSVKNSFLRPNVGFGANFALEKSTIIRIEFEEFYKLGNSDGGTKNVNFFSIGITFQF